MIDYNYLYKKLNKRTPTIKDCGIICKNACCVDTDGEQLGMFLFPDEIEFLKYEKNLTFDKSDFLIEENNVDIAFCEPYCSRDKRPLSCRIFPLFPYINLYGELKIIIDPRGKNICPLTNLDLNDFSSKFIRGVRHTARIIMEDEEGFKFLFHLSRLIDEEIKIKNKFII